MIEVEVKLKIPSAELMEKKLKEIGFKRSQTLQEMDYYFNGPDRNFRETHEALRLRLCESLDGTAVVADRPDTSLVTMTYKGPKLDNVSMSRVEYEAVVDSFEDTLAILSALGYKQVMPVCKLRREFFSEDMAALVDTVSDLGDFLELEIMVDSEDKREEALYLISDVLNKLGYDLSDTTTTSYLSMLEKKL